MKLKRDWANLDALPLSLVLDNLEERIDHVWFSAVCKNWQSIAKLNHQNHQFKTNTLPMLVMPTEYFWTETDFIDEKTWWLYGLPNKRHYPFLQFNQLCLANPKLRLCGSSHGWLALVDDSTSIITLMNPFKVMPHTILPPLKFVYKVTLSVDPIKNPNDYMIVAIHGTSGIRGRDNFSFIRRGQTFWTWIFLSSSSFTDIIFHKDQLFALNIFGNKIVSFNFGSSNDHSDKKTTTFNVVLQENIGNSCFCDNYLVKSLKEELWMVRRCKKHKSAFYVYKLQLDAKSEKVEQLVELNCLEDNILFLGAGDSILVSGSYFSGSLQKNSIYMASYLEIYEVNSEIVNYHCLGHAHEKSNFWVLPHFQWN